MKKYCVGFMFSDDLKRVALIRKQKPEWQKNRLNGIGGSLEEGETSQQAQTREFIEEAGVAAGWQYYLTIQIGKGDNKTTEPGCTVDFFAAVGDLALVKTMTREQVEIHDVASLALRNDLIETVLWAIPMGIECLRTNVKTIALYP